MRPFLEPVERLVLIRDGLYHHDDACRRRAAMLLALDRGSTLSAVARSSRCQWSTVKFWLSRYLENRTPACLLDARNPAVRRSQSPLIPIRARAVLALAESAPASSPGHLGLDPSARDALLHAARATSDPAARLRSSQLLALDRGVAASVIARASGCRRTTIHDLLALTLTGRHPWRDKPPRRR